MDSILSQLTRATASGVAAAMFLEDDSVRDAVADLNDAGFGEHEIYVAFSAEGKRAPKASSGSLDFAEGEHSVSWRIRRSIARDIHRSGASQMGADQATRETQAIEKASKRQYSEVDLEEALLAMGVAEGRIQLLNRELGVNGVLVLVKAFGRLREVQSIFVRNRGLIRTDSATEPAPAAA